MMETFGRYQLISRLAAGGMAEIFLARQEGSDVPVVIKRILPHLAENEYFITMFLDEARLAARLNHPNIVQVIDLGKKGENLFLAMEFIHGDDLRRVVRQAEAAGSPLPIALMVRIVAEVCKGLDYAHKKADASGRPLNIVHRDISPQNILVSFDGAVKVVDFGIAKAADQSTVTRTGVLKGKYSYMSPEQVAGQSLDCRCDVFALGIILHELLTGKRLFKRANDVLTLEAVAQCKVPAPSSVNPRVPSSLDTIVLKALARNRANRFSEARLFGEALEEWLKEQSESATTADLTAFMRKVYKERLLQEAGAGGLTVADEAAQTTVAMTGGDTRPLSQASPSAERKAAASSRVTPKKTETLRGRPVPEVSHPQESSLGTQVVATRLMAQNPVRWPWLVATVVSVGIIGGVGLWLIPAWLMPQGQKRTVLLSVDSEPRGARTSINGEWVGVTPLTWGAAPGAPVELQLELRGYETVSDRFVMTDEAEQPHRYQLGASNPKPRNRK